MQIQLSEWHWLDANETISVQELCRSCSLTRDELEELVGYGVLEPVQAAGEDTLFRADYVPLLRTATRVGRDFDLDVFTVGLLLGYLNRIDVLERRVKTLQALLPAHLHPTAGFHEGPRTVV
jgi:chaperone modulatory protein CbpM